MKDPNDVVDYIYVEHIPLSVEETPEWLQDFLADDDYFDMSR